MTPSHSFQIARPTLSSHLETRQLPDGLLLVKETERARYLAVVPTLQPLLARLDGSRSVGEVLREMLVEPARPSIRAFWDLILSATESGILLMPEQGEERPPPLKGYRWPFGWGSGVALALSLLLVAGGIAAVMIRPPTADFSAGLALAALVTVSLTVSVAHLLAGAVLRGNGRLVYRPRLSLRHGVPAFSVDRRDAFMAGRRAEAAIAMQMLATPFAAAAAGVLLDKQGIILGAAIAFLLLSLPLGDTPGHALVYAVARRGYQVPRCGSRLLKKHFLHRLFSWRDAELDQYVLAYMAYAVLWLALLLHGLALFAEKQGNHLIAALLGDARPLDAVAAAVCLGLLLVALLAPMLFQVWALVNHLVEEIRGHFPVESRLSLFAHASSRPNRDELADTLRLTPIFSVLEKEKLHQLADICAFYTVPAQTLVIREGDRCRNFFMIHDGVAEAFCTGIGGGLRPLRELTRGDLFGEMAMLDGERRAESVRTRQTSSLIVISPSQLDGLIATWNLSEPLPHRLRLVTFLKRVTLFADWPGETLLKLAASFKLQPFKAGDILIRQGVSHDTFHVIYDGSVRVNRDGRRIVDLSESDFFGEISLLTDQPANADVIAESPGHSLTLHKHDFQTFITQSVATGYVLETIAENRTRETARS